MWIEKINAIELTLHASGNSDLLLGNLQFVYQIIADDGDCDVSIFILGLEQDNRPNIFGLTAITCQFFKVMLLLYGITIYLWITYAQLRRG